MLDAPFISGAYNHKGKVYKVTSGGDVFSTYAHRSAKKTKSPMWHDPTQGPRPALTMRLINPKYYPNVWKSLRLMASNPYYGKGNPYLLDEQESIPVTKKAVELPMVENASKVATIKGEYNKKKAIYEISCLTTDAIVIDNFYADSAQEMVNIIYKLNTTDCRTATIDLPEKFEKFFETVEV